MPTTILDNESYPEALQRRYTEEAKNEKNMKLIQMAEEACAPHQIMNTDLEFLERFAALVAAHEKKFWMEQIEVECNEAVLAEREACAKVCDDLSAHYWEKDFPVESINCEECAAAIRARSHK